MRKTDRNRAGPVKRPTWTEKGNWSQIPNRVMADSGISSDAYRVYSNFIRRAKTCYRGDERILRCQVGEDELAGNLGVSDRTVRRAVQELVERGLVSRLRVKYEKSVTYVEDPTKLYPRENADLHDVHVRPTLARREAGSSTPNEAPHMVHVGPELARSRGATDGPTKTQDFDVQENNHVNGKEPPAPNGGAALATSLPADVGETSAGKDPAAAILPADVVSARAEPPLVDTVVEDKKAHDQITQDIPVVDSTVLSPTSVVHVITPAGAAPTIPMPIIQAPPEPAPAPFEAAPGVEDPCAPEFNPEMPEPKPVAREATSVFAVPGKSTRLEGDPGTAVLTTRSGVVKVGAPSGSVGIDVEDPKTATSLWYRFQKAVVENVPNYTPPNKPTSRELGNCKTLLQEYSVKDLLETFKTVACRWAVVQEMWPKVARNPVPDFYTMFTLRRELVAIVQTGKGLSTRTNRFDPIAAAKTPDVGWGHVLDDLKASLKAPKD